MFRTIVFNDSFMLLHNINPTAENVNSQNRHLYLIINSCKCQKVTYPIYLMQFVWAGQFLRHINEVMQSEAVNHRRTDNIITKRKEIKGQTIIYKTIAQKTEDRATRTPLKIGSDIGCTGGDISSCPTRDTRRVILLSDRIII